MKPSEHPMPPLRSCSPGAPGSTKAHKQPLLTPDVPDRLTRTRQVRRSAQQLQALRRQFYSAYPSPSSISRGALVLHQTTSNYFSSIVIYDHRLNGFSQPFLNPCQPPSTTP